MEKEPAQIIKGWRFHVVKSWPDYFNFMLWGTKSFDVRVNDRDYQTGDYIQLREWDPKTEEYTGRTLTRNIIYIMEPAFGMPENMVILGLVKI